MLRHSLWLLGVLVVSGCTGEVERDDRTAEGEAGLFECELDAERDCAAASGRPGLEVCVESGIGDTGFAATEWSECIETDEPPVACKAVNEYGCCIDPIEAECNTPLVLAFDDERVLYTSDVRGSFDLTRNGMSLATDWPTARTPWLALDVDGNGHIDDGGELFGSATRVSSGGFASNGFLALRELDTDRDGRFTANDAAWARVRVWADRDESRTSEPAELTGLDELGVVSIDLGYRIDRRCDARGNCEVERAGFRYRDATGALRDGTVIDVHLGAQK